MSAQHENQFDYFSSIVFPLGRIPRDCEDGTVVDMVGVQQVGTPFIAGIVSGKRTVVLKQATFHQEFRAINLHGGPHHVFAANAQFIHCSLVNLYG